MLQPQQGQGAYLHLSFPGVGERGEGPFLSCMLLLGVGVGGRSLVLVFIQLLFLELGDGIVTCVIYSNEALATGGYV